MSKCDGYCVHGMCKLMDVVPTCHCTDSRYSGHKCEIDRCQESCGEHCESVLMHFHT